MIATSRLKKVTTCSPLNSVPCWSSGIGMEQLSLDIHTHHVLIWAQAQSPAEKVNSR